MNINKGIGANRTSYNEKQEISSYNIGILKKNTNIRNDILSKNIGKYSMYKETLSPAIGEYYELYDRNNTYIPMGEGGIFEYTNSNSSPFGYFINNKYYRDEHNIESYEILDPNPISLAKWGGKYDNYINYIYQTYGHELKFTNFLYEILSENDIKYAMMDNMVGVVRDINVSNSLGGVMITNINNLSGDDTNLGKFTNKMYALTLRNAAYFNSLRNTKYITPRLMSEYGNNLTNINKLANMFPISDENGRLTYDIGYGSFIRKIEDGIDDVSKYTLINLSLNEDENFDYSYYDNIDLSENKNIINNDNIFIEKNISIKKRYNPLSPYAKNILDYFINTDGVLLNNGIEIINDSNLNTVTKNVNSDGNVYYEYSEGDSNKTSNNDITVYNSYGDVYNSIPIEYNKTSLIDRTNKLFNARKIGTLIGRFHTTIDTSPDHNIPTLTQSAVSIHGLSHGRNLLKKGRNTSKNSDDNVNGYDNPYCRVWTYHHQYNKIKDLIRPFIDDSNDRIYSIDELQNIQSFSRHENGAKHLSSNTVLNQNGFVNITPTSNGISIKKCMFSIENLAWKDVLKNNKNISNEQVGPLGGRIMWFPPYNIKFSENTSVGWNSNDFIGRGEKIYSYINTERSGTLNFTLLIDHPSILDYWKNGKENTKETDDDILRFFAGCDTLDFNDKTISSDDNKEITTNNSIEPIESISNQNSIVFYVFFPNNYSGVDDMPTTVSSNINSILYLFAGEGIQKNNLMTLDDLFSDYNNDIETFIEKHPGYEMSNSGITTKDDPESSGDVIEGKYGNWAYRIDSEYQNQKLKSVGNYYDYVSYNLNSKLSDSSPSDATYTFSEFFTAYYMDKYNGDKILKMAISHGSDENRINELNKIINNTGLTVSKIDISGGASSHGTNVNNNKLNKNRCKTIENWVNEVLTDKNKNRLKNAKRSNKGNTINSVSNNSQSNLDAKIGRYARVEIYFENTKVDALSNTNPYTTNNSLNNYSNEFNEEINNTINTESINNNYNNNLTTIVSSNRVSRYENESDFFTTLSNMNDSFIKKRIIDKVKYFDPAFHSISPEGFNSRLTFLQQCTRQGNTIEYKNNTTKTAGNLAFGRPPVCVLRIGDFFYTRIIIESMTIDYEPLVWDINPEGIGVQPMFANISLTFKFIGGSDLGGPISRLQNAVSFNYYANSSVYDDRSDRVTYENNDSKYNNSDAIYNNIWVPEN